MDLIGSPPPLGPQAPLGYRMLQNRVPKDHRNIKKRILQSPKTRGSPATRGGLLGTYKRASKPRTSQLLLAKVQISGCDVLRCLAELGEAHKFCK